MPYSLRSRTHSPLAELPIDRYIPAKRASTSPTPRGSKRHQPYASTSSSSSVASSSKDGHPQRFGEDGDSTKSPIKKRTRTVTPGVKQVLDRDDLGVGKSPARRLFATCIAESSSHSTLGGISGAVLTLPFNAEIRATQGQIAIQNQTSIQYEDGNGDKEDIHDPGFVIHPDAEGRPHARSNSRSASPFVSSTLSELALDNQENIPPPLLPSTSSTCSTASIPRTPHSRRSGGCTSTTSSSHRVDSYLYLSPSSSSHSHHSHWSPYSPHSSHSHGHTPGSRRREQSKLVNELLLVRGEDVPGATSSKTRTRTQVESRSRTKREKEVLVPDELTPGRRTTRGMVRRGKDLLAEEVDSV
ncbi:hypothetical protein CNBI3430 [Cryptococcus gattii WM276]|uniref:Uncharacterized protein n=1 Tax=Cryptococcus gattii serotype B (strain WM276 / ATCC MYA-4071) TaxID=367775 RepID=E6RBI6_CRYGW|nr:uncharacterized protein CGB_I4350C [Cryptococcus gattii WM276]ADV24510.1 hypothetical protein CNBI3430 [Cryptococcus gattii WM276]